MEFFNHYRSPKSQEKYEILKTDTFKSEFDQFEEYIKSYWTLGVCERFCLSVRTNSVESFFATRLYFVPKDMMFSKTYAVRMKLCGLQWNAHHISSNYKTAYGCLDRLHWQQNIHEKVFKKHRPGDYVEKRGRPRKPQSEISYLNIKKQKVRTNTTSK